MNTPSSAAEHEVKEPQFAKGSYWYVKNTNSVPPMPANEVAGLSSMPRRGKATLGNASLDQGTTLVIDESFQEAQTATFRVVVPRVNELGQRVGYAPSDKTIYSATFDELSRYIKRERRGIDPASDIGRMVDILDPATHNKLEAGSVRASDNPERSQCAGRVSVANNLPLLNSVAAALREKLTELGHIK